METKQELLKKLRKDISEAKLVKDEDIRYVVISCMPLMWCLLPDNGCLFGKNDRIKDFEEELVKNINNMYPEYRMESLFLSDKPASASNNPMRNEEFFFEYPESKVLYVSHVKRNGCWKACMLTVM